MVFEAAAEAGGQVRLAANLGRKREIQGIIRWRVRQCAKQGVEMRCNTYAEAGDVLAERPDVVFAATGGLPNLSFLEAGTDLVITSGDILSGRQSPPRPSCCR